eukprot:1017768-Amorphochlora_amoeboformis.AAC.1
MMLTLFARGCQCTCLVRKLLENAHGLSRGLRMSRRRSALASLSTKVANHKSTIVSTLMVLCASDVEAKEGSLKKGWWDSTHVFQVSQSRGDNYEYKLTSTVMISMVMENGKIGSCDLSGSMNKQKSETKAINKQNGTNHLINMGNANLLSCLNPEVAYC